MDDPWSMTHEEWVDLIKYEREREEARMASRMQFDATFGLKHKDRDGGWHFVAGMDDEHLMNTLKVFAKPAAEVVKALGVDTSQMSARGAALYGVVQQVMDPEESQKKLSRAIVKCGPYLWELVLRGKGEECAALIREVMQREGADPEAALASAATSGRALPDVIDTMIIDY